MSQIQFQNVAFSYSSEKVLDGLSFNIKPGQKISLIGRNGTGKSTTLKIACGLLRPQAGEVLVNDGDPETEEIKRGIGYLPEEPMPYRLLSVRENIEYSAALRGVQDPVSAAFDAMDLFDLRHLEMVRASGLSRGNRQRLGLAMATVHKPKVMILDEPLNYLDIPTQELLVKLLKNSSSTVLVSTHLVATATRLTDSMMVLSSGRISWEGTYGDLDAFGQSEDSMESKISRLMQTASV